MHVKSFLVCDDIRHELGNKLTLVGVYGDAIVFPPGHGAMALPKLGVLVVIAGLKGVGTMRYRHVLTRDGGPIEAPFAEIAREPEGDEHNFILQVSPFVVPGAGRYRVVLEIEAGSETRLFEHWFEVRRARGPTVH